MANTLTSLAADIYNARDQVAREAVGVVSSVLVNTGSEVAAFGDTVRSFVTAAPTLNTSYLPAMTIPNSDDQTVSSLTLTIDQVANVKIGLTGEELRHLDNGAGAERVRVDMFAQAFRKIVNTVEAYSALALAKAFSRAAGTAGTTPFVSNFNTINSVRQIILDNGGPVTAGGMSLVINSAAGTNLRNLSNLFKVNEAGSDNLLRKGELANLSGFSIKESAGVVSTAAGTGANYTTTAAGFAVGTTSIPLITGTGTVLAGDIVTFAGDTNQYVVTTGAAAPGTIVIASPGLLVAMSAATKAMTIAAASTRNLAFDRSSAELVMRAPAQPYGGDAAVDRMTLSDGLSGLNFEVAEYKGYGKVLYDITTFYTAKVWKPDFGALLLG